GPERTLVKLTDEPDVEAGPGRSAYERWAEAVRQGAAVVTNGPLLELTVEGREPGAVVAWKGESIRLRGVARALFHRPLQALALVVSGQVTDPAAGDGRQATLRLSFDRPITESVWVAARVRGQRTGDDPLLQAHTNPVYFHRDRRPVHVRAAREAVV